MEEFQEKKQLLGSALFSKRGDSNFWFQMGLLAVLLFSLLLLHGYRFWDIGTEGVDAIYYQRMGIQWSLGNFDLFCKERPLPHLLPVLYGVAGIFYKVVGIHDFTFKLINLVSLSGIFCLLFLIARQLAMVFPYTLLPGLIFLLLPSIITQSRTELTHLLAAFFVLLSFFFLNDYRRLGKTFCLVLSALTLHAAMMTHTDLALLAPGFLAVLLFGKKNKNPFKTFVLEELIFTLFFLLPFAAYGFFWGFTQIYESFHQVQALSPRVPGKHFPMLTLEFLTIGFKAHLGIPLLMAFYGGLALELWRGIVRKEGFQGAMVLLPVAGYLLLFEGLIFRNRLEPLIRVLIPLIPFLCLYLAGLVQRWCSFSKLWTVRGAVILYLLYAQAFNFNDFLTVPSFAFYRAQDPVPFYQYQTVYRHLYKLLKDKTNSQTKVLISPSQFRNDYDTFNLPFYFNGNAVPLRKCLSSKNSFDSFLKSEKIRFVFIGKQHFYQKEWPKNGVQGISPGCLDLSQPYTAKDELQRLMTALAPHHPIEIYHNDYYGTVYEIPDPTRGQSSLSGPEDAPV